MEWLSDHAGVQTVYLVGKKGKGEIFDFGHFDVNIWSVFAARQPSVVIHEPISAAEQNTSSSFDEFECRRVLHSRLSVFNYFKLWTWSLDWRHFSPRRVDIVSAWAVNFLFSCIHSSTAILLRIQRSTEEVITCSLILSPRLMRKNLWTKRHSQGLQNGKCHLFDQINRLDFVRTIYDGTYSRKTSLKIIFGLNWWSVVFLDQLVLP